MAALNEYLDEVANFQVLTQKEQVKFMCYFYSVSNGIDSFTAAEIRDCFLQEKLRLPANINNELFKLISEKPAILLRTGTKYSFQRNAKKDLDSTFSKVNESSRQNLYNVYLNAAGQKQIKYALSLEEVNELVDAINAGIAAVIVGAKTFELIPFRNIAIFDFSKGKVNLSNKGLVKEEINRVNAALRSGAIELFTHFGIDITSHFKINPLLTTIQTSNMTTKKVHVMRKVFISHSSKDKLIVGKLIDIIEAIGVSSDSIFCSSYTGYGIELGENFLERLKQELSNDVLVLFLLTGNFYESPICLCEMGAAWITTSEHVPVLVPPFDYKDVKGVFPLTQGIKINDSEGLNSLKVKLEKMFQLTANQNPSVWERKRGDILNQLSQILI